ncbi:MAG: hypothetical protein ACO1OC_13450 [Tuberibacillus sp.]
MKYKLIAVFLSVVFVIGFGVINGGAALAETNQLSNSSTSVNSDELEKAAQTLEKYVVVADNGTIQLLSDYTVAKVDPEYVESIITWMDQLNEAVKAGDISIDKDLTVTAKDESILQVTSGGISGIKYYWWGFKIYLNHSATNRVASALAAGASAATIASIISGALPTPPTAISSTIVKAAAFIMGFGASYIVAKDKGKGVYIRITGSIPTGVFSQ